MFMKKHAAAKTTVVASVSVFSRASDTGGGGELTKGHIPPSFTQVPHGTGTDPPHIPAPPPYFKQHILSRATYVGGMGGAGEGEAGGRSKVGGPCPATS